MLRVVVRGEVVHQDRIFWECLHVIYHRVVWMVLALTDISSKVLCLRFPSGNKWWRWYLLYLGSRSQCGLDPVAGSLDTMTTD